MLILLLAMAFAQSPTAFEAASIKPSTADMRSGSGITTTPGRIHGENVTVRRCLQGAYNLPKAQIIGGPPWLDEDRYEIIATAASPAGDAGLMGMLQTLLAERFKIAVHRETRPLRGYALTVAKSGLKMKASEPGTGARTNSCRGVIDARACPLKQLALKLSAALNAPVADLTQTPGAFDFTLKWSPEEARADVDSGPSLFSAVQEQLGLKLEGRNVPTEVLVVDHAERIPTEN